MLFLKVGTSHNEDIMHSFQKFIVVSLPITLPPVKTRICKLVVRALNWVNEPLEISEAIVDEDEARINYDHLIEIENE